MVRLNELAQGFEAEMFNQQSLLWRYAIAQSCLESAYFRSTLVRTTNNAWGIKYVGQAGATGVEFPTREYNANGTSYKTTAAFCKWDTVEEATSAYYSLVMRRYRPAWRARTPMDYFNGLKGWATDPRYPELCMSVYNRLNP